MKRFRLVVIAAVMILSLCGCAEKIMIPMPSPTQSYMTSPTPEPTSMQTLPPKPTPVPTPTPEAAATSMWGAKFLGKFSSGEVIRTENSYISEHVNVTVKKVKQKDIVYFLADIYITDLKYFVSPFSGGAYNKGARNFVSQIARDNSAVIAINGDYYTENTGPVLRDGVLYRNEISMDILVMFKDGTMKTYSQDEYSKETIAAMTDDIWQIWTFGPMLLQDGKTMTEFNLLKNVSGVNPRTAIGYYEPGHYAFVTVDGRQPGYSLGLDLENLSKLMAELGCKVAFNLDGGGTAQMAFMGKEINEPSVHRKAREAICIIDETASAKTTAK